MKSINLQSLEVAQVMLITGNSKSQTAAKELQDIKLKTEKLQGKLRKLKSFKKSSDVVGKQPS